MSTDISEKGLESHIANYLVERNGYRLRTFDNYNRELCLDMQLLFEFLETTQNRALERLKQIHGENYQQKIANRINDRIKSKGVIDILRKGVTDNGVNLTLLYNKPISNLNPKSEEFYGQNIFSVMRQLHYSRLSEQSLDIGIFINGIPVTTCELKNELTKQNVWDAINQYRKDRDPREPLFGFGRCMVHLAVDSDQIYMTTRLYGEKTFFLPFNKGYNDGKGNPPNPDGIKTSYLWEEVLAKDSLVDIIENYACIITETDEDGDKKTEKLIFPRYHQLDVVKKLLNDAKTNGAGRRYLIQHSAGSGKSNSITWLSHQLVGLHDKNGENTIFDSVVVVTDRTVLDEQIRENIKQFAQVEGVVEAITEGSRHLREALEDGKKIIVTTIQKFPYILEDIGQLPSNRFAIVIDEAHSSQSGETSRKLNQALSKNTEDDEEKTDEDKILEAIAARKMLDNASYFAFTATPKNKTIELFGQKDSDGKPRPFHVYTMKQAIEEGFILDVLKNYTTYNTYFKIVKKITDDPQYDAKAAKRRIAKFIGTDPRTIEKKAEVMINHFMNSVIASRKINGHAKAMVVTASRKAAIEYKKIYDKILTEKGLPFKTLVAFSGEIEGQTEDSMNGFSGALIKKTFKKDEYRFLIVANKFQTGFDQPLLHTMYVDKQLHGVMAVQTLSRLNRIKPPYKKDTFVLDFVNEAEEIQKSFEPFYKTTLLAETTDPNLLFDIKDSLAEYQIYSGSEVKKYADLIMSNASITELHSILDNCVVRFKELILEEQYDVISKVKTITRMYAFLSQIVPFESIELEQLYIFLSNLKDKLQPDKAEDNTADLLSNIDLDSYRVQLVATQNIALTGDTELQPLGPETARATDLEVDNLSNIVKGINDRFGDIEFSDADRLRKTFEDLTEEVRSDEEYIRATEGTDKQNSWITFQKVLTDKFHNKISSDFDLFKKFTDDKEFKEFLSERLFEFVWKERTRPKDASALKEISK